MQFSELFLVGFRSVAETKTGAIFPSTLDLREPLLNLSPVWIGWRERERERLGRHHQKGDKSGGRRRKVAS
jgi:hypothetical protein